MKNELNADAPIAWRRGLTMPFANLISVLNSDFSFTLYVSEVENLLIKQLILSLWNSCVYHENIV